MAVDITSPALNLRKELDEMREALRNMPPKIVRVPAFVSPWEADPSDGEPWLRLPLGKRVGRHGWIVRDGSVMMASDYEEITVLGQTWIKPLVAPGVNTEFDVYCGVNA